MRIAFCGSDYLATGLRRMLEDGHVLAAVFSETPKGPAGRNGEILKLARDAGAGVTLERMRPHDVRRLGALGVDLILSALYTWRIPPWQGEVGKAMNLHPAPLPIGRGPRPIPWVVAKGLTRSAVVLHEISEGFDEGDIVASWPFELTSRDTTTSVAARGRLIANRHVPAAIADLDRLWANRTPQGPGEYWPGVRPQDRVIRWTDQVARVDRMLRAFSHLGLYIQTREQTYRVLEADVWEEAHGLAPGSRPLGGEHIFALADGFIAFRRFQARRRD